MKNSYPTVTKSEKAFSRDDCSINLMKLVKAGDEVLEKREQQFRFGFS
jgi:hypothetical protein